MFSATPNEGDDQRNIQFLASICILTYLTARKNFPKRKSEIYFIIVWTSSYRTLRLYKGTFISPKQWKVT
jgi:hypothetical protein